MSEKRFSENPSLNLRRWDKEIAEYPNPSENKRFYAEWGDEDSYRLIDNLQGFQIATLLNADVKGIVDLLNELAEGNEQLQKTINAQKKGLDEYIDNIIALSKENEQLRFQLDECSNNKLFSRRELERENEQLRQQLAEKQEEEKLYAEEILKLREINQFNELGGDY